MSIERVVEAPNQPSVKSLAELKAEEAATTQETRDARKARFASVLERGVVNVRLQVDLPSTVHGEWVRNSPENIYRKQLLGFTIDTQYATNNSLHGDGSGKAVIGDVVFMTCAKSDYELLKEIERDTYDKMNRTTKEQKEELDYRKAVDRESQSQLPVITESRATKARKEELAAALQAAAMVG